MDLSLEYNNINLNNYIQNLPDEAIIIIAKTLHINNITNLCLINKRFNNLVCNNNYFWEHKFRQDFGNVNFEAYNCDKNTDPLCWKSLYINAHDIWLINDEMQLGRVTNIYGIDITYNENNFIVIDINNDIWVWGSNTRGELGVGHFDEVKNPLKIPNIKAKKVTLSNFGTILIDINNDVWITGNVTRHLDIVSFVFIKIPNLKAIEVSINNDHMALIDLDNNIWVSGFGEYGELGLGPDVKIAKLKMIPGFKIKKIACGIFCTAFIDMNNDVWTFGHNLYGQLGLGDTNPRYIPTKITGIKGKKITMKQHTIVIDTEGKMWGFGINTEGQLGSNLGKDLILSYTNELIIDTPIIIDEHRLWKNIALNKFSSVALDKNNNIWISGTGKNFTYKNFMMMPNFKCFKISGGGFIGIHDI